jgi:hypothetical protein
LPRGRPGARGGRYFRTVRGETWIPSFRRSSLAIRSSPHEGFSIPMRRIRDCTCLGMGGRPGRDFRRQNNFQPARCQRIIVSGRTTTKASRQLKNRESNASVIRVTGSIRRGLTPRSTYKASCRRRNRFSVLIDCGDRNASRNQRNVSTTNWLMIPETISIGR